jgi:hypothetical protein
MRIAHPPDERARCGRRWSRAYPPNDSPRHLQERGENGGVRQQNISRPEDKIKVLDFGLAKALTDRPLAAPIFTNLIADTHDIRTDDLMHAMDRGIDFRLFRNGRGHLHLEALSRNLTSPLAGCSFVRPGGSGKLAGLAIPRVDKGSGMAGISGLPA